MTGELQGLTADQAAERVREGKVNTLPERSGCTAWQIVRDNVFTRVNVILAVLSVIVTTTTQFAQGALAVLIVTNSIIGMVQGLRAKHILDNLAVIGEAHPVVLRDGQRVSPPRGQVVADGLIALPPGDQVVVGGEVVATDCLEVDESVLAGKADPVAKSVGDELMSGAFVASGSGVYRAAKIDAEAYTVQLIAQAAKFTLVNSELRAGIDHILKLVTWPLIPAGLFTIWVQFHQPDTTWQESALRMAGALVSMIPEGPMLLILMAFALSVIRLGRRKCLVQELPAIEGLARVSVVCADKTGTLTQNAMTLGGVIPLAGGAGEVTEILVQLVAADPTPNTSITAIVEATPAASSPREVTARAPFTSAKKWSGISFGTRGDWVLGAPDVLAPADVATRVEEIGSTGRRVLLLGRASEPADSSGVPGMITPVTLLVLDQLVRPDVAGILAYFNDQYVAVKVILGGNAVSVGAVTRSLGVSVAEAADARTLSAEGEELTKKIAGADVFRRVTPQQKYAMVAALQSRDHIVAMTGDGVNDVFALKDADLGVAMGSGSPTTRVVAQAVLLDDRFATSPHVVAEGRRVIGNIKRVTKLFLSKTVYAVFLTLVIGLMGLPSPFIPLRMTVVGWFTIGIPAFLLSLPPNKERARSGFVRRALSLAVPSGVTIGAASTITYVVTRGFGVVPAVVQVQASTVTPAALIITSVWVLAVVARPWVWWRFGLMVVSYTFYLAMFLIPWAWLRGQLLLDLDNPPTILFGVVAGLVGTGLVEIVWWLTARHRGEPARIRRGSDEG